MMFETRMRRNQVSMMFETRMRRNQVSCFILEKSMKFIIHDPTPVYDVGSADVLIDAYVIVSSVLTLGCRILFLRRVPYG
jgi:hypothetical protein